MNSAVSGKRTSTVASYLHPGAVKVPRSLKNVLSLADFEAAAKRRLPRPIFGYVAGSAEDNRSFTDNRRAFAEYAFKPRVLCGVEDRSQAVKLFGVDYSSPFGIAPMGLGSLSAYQADLSMARAAAAAGIPMIVSGSSLIRLEDVIAVAPQAWFQAYLPGDPERIGALLQRVSNAGYQTLVVTVDLPVAGNRENNVRSGFSTPLRPSLRLAVDGLLRPRWLGGTLVRTLLRHGMPHFENSFAERGAPVISKQASRDFSSRAHLSWDHIELVRQRWRGTLILKGILDIDDVRKAQAAGADGVIVSNHGGRQLDGAVAPLRVLHEMATSLPGFPMMMDGGVRRGSDVLTALALGARFVFIGRPFNFAVATAGETGVSHAIDLVKAEVDRNMAMLGIRRCADAHVGMLQKIGA